MAALATAVPARRPELVIRPLGDRGRYVVKNQRSGEFFHIGEQEQFLLSKLDGIQTAHDVCAAYTKQFHEPLSESDFDGFLKLARSKGLLQTEKPVTPEAPKVQPGSHQPKAPDRDVAHAPPRPSGQSILYWRKSLL